MSQPPGRLRFAEHRFGAFAPARHHGNCHRFRDLYLLQRGDLRDRFIGLIGSHDLHRTTKALDDAAFRLSRYFLALTGVNTAFGIAIT